MRCDQKGQSRWGSRRRVWGVVLSGITLDGAPERVVHGVEAELRHGGRRPRWGHQGFVCGILCSSLKQQTKNGEFFAE